MHLNSQMVYRFVDDPTGELFCMSLPMYATRLPRREQIPNLPKEPVEVVGIYCQTALVKIARVLDGTETRYRHIGKKVLMFGWSGMLGVDGVTSYGRYRDVLRSEFYERPCVLSFMDYRPSFHWLDVLHNPSPDQNEERTLPTKPIL